MPGYLRTVAVVLVTAFCAVMWGFHIHSHVAGPDVGEGTLDYSRLLAPGKDKVSRRYGVYLLGGRLGEVHTTVSREKGGGLRVRNKTHLEGGQGLRAALGASAEVNVEFTARLKPLTGLKHFSLLSPELDVMVNGRPADDGLLLTGRIRGESINMTVPVNQRQFIGGLLSPMSGMPRLSREAVGRTWQIPLVNPLTGKVENVEVRVKERRAVKVDSETWALYRLRLSASGRTWNSWVREDGELLVQGTPFGLTLRREELPKPVLEATGA